MIEFLNNDIFYFYPTTTIKSPRYTTLLEKVVSFAATQSLTEFDSRFTPGAPIVNEPTEADITGPSKADKEAIKVRRINCIYL